MGAIHRLLTCAGIAAVFAGCAHRPAPAATPAPTTVTVATARNGTIVPAEQLAGIIAPHQSVELSSTLAEPAVAVYVREGDRVRRGEVLAQLATDDLRATLAATVNDANANVARTAQTTYQARYAIVSGNDQVRSARAALTQARATLASAQLELERDVAAYRVGYSAKNQAELERAVVVNDAQAVTVAQATLRTAQENEAVNGTQSRGLQQQNIAAARSTAQASYSQADEIRSEIARAAILSPVDGMVINRNINPGEFPGSRALFTLQADAHVYAVLDASSREALAIREGGLAYVKPEGSRDAYAGKIVAVLDQISPGSTNFAVKADVPNEGGALRAGMPVTATVELPHVRGVIVPSTAFLDDTHTSVMSVDSRGSTKPLAVTEVATDGSHAVVRGVPAGVRVVVDGTSGLTGGQIVRAK